MNLKKFTDYDTWVNEAERLGLKGPLRMPGLNNWAFFGTGDNSESTHPVAVWHGDTGQGTVEDKPLPSGSTLFVKHENATQGTPPASGILGTSTEEAPPWARPGEPRPAGNTTLTPLDPTAGVPLKTENKVNTPEK